MFSRIWGSAWLVLFMAGLSFEDSWSRETLGGQTQFQYGTLTFHIHGEVSQLKTMNLLRDILHSDPDTVKLLNYFRYPAQGVVHFLVEEEVKRVNGSARVVPHNAVTLFNYPPLDGSQLAVSYQWLKILALHELAHVVHMDQTRGGVDWLRNIFGSIAKFGMWVPRWFSEGIAVWAESQFSGSGRLRSTLLQRELYRRLRHDGQLSARHHVGRLDAPGEYPFGHYPYWAGGFFMDWLERRKPGTIRCLVVANSRRLPFTANGAFRECGGGGVAQLFGQFRREFLSAYEGRSFTPSSLRLPHGREIAWFAGSIVQKTTLYYAYWEEGTQFVGSYDFATKKFRSYQVSGSIERIALNGPWVEVTSYVGFKNRGKRRSWRLVAGELVARGEWSGDYEFSTSGGQVVFRYHSLQWTISNAGGKTRHLPPGQWVFRPEVHGGKVFFILASEASGMGQVLGLDAKSLELTNYHQSTSGNLFFAGSCGDKTYLLEGGEGKAQLLELEGAKSWSSAEINRIIFLHFSPQGVFVLERGGPRFYFTSCQEYLRQLVGKSQRPRVESLAVTGDARYREPGGLEPYPAWEYFVPQYWYFTLAWSEKQAGRGAVRTLLSDPRGDHSLELEGRFFQDHHWGPRLAYVYQLRDFFGGGQYHRDFIQNARSRQVDERESVQVFSGYRFLGEVWSYTPQLFVTQDREIDLLASRSSVGYGLRQSLLWDGLRRRQLSWREFSVSNVVSYVRPAENFAPYWSLRMRFDGEMDIDYRRWLGFHLGYSRLFKSNMKGGVVQGGGVSPYHDFHGLDYSALYGNSIASGGGYGYWRVGTPYWQSGLFPLQWQELGGVLGVDYAEADGVVIGGGLPRRRAYAVYGGVRAKVRAFYHVSGSGEVLLSRVASGGLSQWQFLLLWRGRAF